MNELKGKKLKYNIFFLTLGVFIFILGVGFVLNDIDLKERGRSLASQNQSPEDKELVEIATKKVIAKMNLAKDLDYGGDPTKLEEFVYGELKGQYKIFNKDESTLKIIKVGDEGVVIKDYHKFTLKVFNLLILKDSDFSIEKVSRDVASKSDQEAQFTVKNSEQQEIAKIKISSNEAKSLESFTLQKLN